MKCSLPLQRLCAYLPVLCGLLLAPAQALAQEELPSQSPFFVIKSESGDKVDQFPLKSTEVSVNIAGVIADVRIRQEYENLGDATLEALYIFPASTRAAVYGLEMQVGDRQIVAEVQEKEKARKAYEKAKKQGQTASLLEQKRPNVFQMSVGHILPKDRIVVELRYTELLIPENATYEFMFPTIVGPRYTENFSQNLLAQDQWTQNPYLEEGQAPTYNYNITTQINAGMPLKKVASPSHQVDVDFLGKTIAEVTLPPSTRAKSGIKDYVLRYQLAGKTIESGLLTFEGEKENFFLAMIQPPKQVKEKDMPPKELVFILDVSGSMRGFPLEITKEMINGIVANMRPQDRFNIMLFESSNTLLSPESLPPTKANVKAAAELLDKLRGSGGTKLLPALKNALNMPAKQGYSRSFVIVTDGFISVEKQVFDVIRENLGNANVFAIGAGSSVNRYLIEGMARAGQGEPLIAINPKEASVQAARYQQYISQPILTDIDIQFGQAEVYDVEPLSIPDVLAERPIVVFGKYKGRPSGQLTLKGVSGEGAFKASLPWGSAKASPQNQALKYLWARHKIATLSDYTQLAASLELAEEITELGLQYNLLTAYTSFIAIDPNARQSEGEGYQVKQALPLPKGVSNTALGSNKLASSLPIDGSSGSSRSASAPEPQEGAYRAAPRSKATEAAAISWNMPKKQPVFIDRIALGWADKGASETTSYKVAIKNFMGEVLWERQTQERAVALHLKDDIFQDRPASLLVATVEVEGQAESVVEIALEILQKSKAAEFVSQGASLLLAKDLPGRLELAQYYESQGMYANAFGVLHQLKKENPRNPEIKSAYQAFITRMGWN